MRRASQLKIPRGKLPHENIDSFEARRKNVLRDIEVIVRKQWLREEEVKTTLTLILAFYLESCFLSHCTTDSVQVSNILDLILSPLPQLGGLMHSNIGETAKGSREWFALEDLGKLSKLWRGMCLFMWCYNGFSSFSCDHPLPSLREKGNGTDLLHGSPNDECDFADIVDNTIWSSDAGNE